MFFIVQNIQILNFIIQRNKLQKINRIRKKNTSKKLQVNAYDDNIELIWDVPSLCRFPSVRKSLSSTDDARLKDSTRFRRRTSFELPIKSFAAFFSLDL